MAKFIKTIPQDKFDMGTYREDRSDGNHEHQCNTIGCVLGHSTILSPKIELPREYINDIDINFEAWGEKFTGLSPFSDEWDWCFNSSWKKSDNTPEGASKRIEYMLNHGLPENWKNQMFGKAPLSY